MADASQAPALQIVRGTATPEEIAALVAVLSALGSARDDPTPARTPEWQANHRKVRATLPHGAAGWRSSGLPR